MFCPREELRVAPATVADRAPLIVDTPLEPMGRATAEMQTHRDVLKSLCHDGSLCRISAGTNPISRYIVVAVVRCSRACSCLPVRR
jgi:hypothetical protein